MKKYWKLLDINFQTETAYRLEAFNWLIISALSTITSALLFYTISKNGSLNNYLPGQIATYIILSFLLERFLYWYFCHWFGNSIKKGGLSNHLIKPYKYLIEVIISEVSGKIIFTLPYLIIATILILLFGGTINLQLENIVLFIPVFILAIIMNIIFTFLISFAAFFTINNHSIINLYFYLVPLLGGRVFPIDIIPKIYFDILTFLPFPYSFFYPLKILSVGLPTDEIVKVIIIQIFWIIIFGTLAKLMYKKGVKEYDAAGN